MRKKSSYKPRPIIRDTLSWVLGGFRPLTDIKDENVKLRLRNHTAFDSVIHGDATVQDLDTLIAMSNMTTALSRKHGADWREEIRTAADAIEAMQKRFYRWQKVQGTAAEIEAIALLLRIHDAQLDATRIADFDEAIKVARRGELGATV